MFNDTSRYLVDIVTIDNHEIEKHFTELQLKQAFLKYCESNTSPLPAPTKFQEA